MYLDQQKNYSGSNKLMFIKKSIASFLKLSVVMFRGTLPSNIVKSCFELVENCGQLSNFSEASPLKPLLGSRLLMKLIK